MNCCIDLLCMYCLLSIAAKISLAESFYKFIEFEGVALICVILKNPVKRNVSFELEYRELSAGEKFHSLAIGCAFELRTWVTNGFN